MNTQAAAIKAASASGRSPHRLACTVLPEFYDLKITPDLPSSTFTGEEEIRLVVTRPTNEIVLNSAAIAITSAVASQADGTSLEGSVALDEEAQRATIRFSGTLGSGTWVLRLEFSGILDPKLRGFYRVSYKDQAGKEHLLATTKFEPSDARRAFPCFDEPEFKAVFKVSLVIDADQTALSNMQVEEERILAATGKKLVSFAPSIKMSSYLVFYCVGHFECTDAVQVRGTELRVWCVPGKKRLGKFGLEAGAFALSYLTDYFACAYPSEKLDLIAIPNFASGAMENYGAVTFRETALLLDAASASQAELERVAEVVAHELAHMWFGDLVTMTWWNGLWLNEAFATFMAAKVVDSFRSQWRFWDGFNISKAAALRLDGLASSRPIEFPVHTPEDARAMFDLLTYEKGCAVLRMLELYLGEELFRQGIRRYIKRHLYANADTPDLWAAIEEEVRQAGLTVPVAKMMSDWVYQQGYPVVTVEKADLAGCVRLSQEPFRYLGASDTASLWHVPVTLRVRAGTVCQEQTVALTRKSQVVYVGEDFDLVVANAGGRGFFRVRYSEELRRQLFENLEQLEVSERFNLMSDLWSDVLAGKLELRAFLLSAGTLCAEKREGDPNVWSVVAGAVSYLRRLFAGAEPEVRDGLASLARSLAAAKLAELGLEPPGKEDAHASQLRATLVAMLGPLGDDKVKAKAESLFQRYLADRQSLDANLVPAVVDTVASCGDETRYEQFLKLRQDAATPQEESRYLFALAGFTQEELAERTARSALEGGVPTQDIAHVLLKLLLNPHASWKTWTLVTKNWSKLVSLLPLQGVMRLCDGLPALVDPEREQEVREFLAAHTVKGTEKAQAQNLEQLAIANRFWRKYRDELAGLLLAGYSPCDRG